MGYRGSGFWYPIFLSAPPTICSNYSTIIPLHLGAFLRTRERNEGDEVSRLHDPYSTFFANQDKITHRNEPPRNNKKLLVSKFSPYPKLPNESRYQINVSINAFVNLIISILIIVTTTNTISNTFF